MEKNKALLQTLKKIPIFKGLSPSHVQKVLGLCEAKTFKEKETGSTRIRVGENK
jgi:hypothetical protein